MGYAEEVIKSLLLEEVEQNKVAYAVKKRHEVSFKYDSGDGDPRGKMERITVQPVALGTTKAGNPCFRAYQINGSSESAEKKEGVIPGWRLFLLDRVVPNTWRDTGKIFKEPPMYNPNGDKTMAEVLVQADFAGSSQRYERGGLKKYNQQRHDKAVEQNPYYDFEKQLAKKRMAPDFVKKNIADTDVDARTRAMQWKQARMAQVPRGNEQSIEDMARQKDFGDEDQTETVGPMRKGEQRNATTTQTRTTPRYAMAQQNGPMYKGQIRKNEDNLEDNGDELEQRPGKGPADDAGRKL
ncbi:MAG: hypothetical protein J6Y37_10245 [Paludibacteraceae bacterium]|nr:hypothetical protein [Paludibacteraceae bacterium]